MQVLKDNSKRPSPPRKAMSHRRANRNPWNQPLDEWIGQIKLFVVNRLTRESAIGEIEPGLQAKLDFAPLDTYIKKFDKSGFWQSHTWVAFGDCVSGIVTEIRYPDEYDEPEIIIDAGKLLEQIEEDPALMADQIDFSNEDLPTIRPSEIFDPAPNIHNIFIFDRDMIFLDRVSDALTAAGYNVRSARSKDEANEKLQKITPNSIQLALIELNLLSDVEEFGGLWTAKEINELHRHCKIILTSSEEIRPDSIEKVKAEIRNIENLKIVSYLEKPLTVNQLHSEIAIAAFGKGKKLEDVFKSQTDDKSASPYWSQAKYLHTEVATREKRQSIKQTVDELGNDLKDVVVHIFKMHPIKKNGESVAHYGGGLNWEKVRHKLEKSPVRDTAIDPDRKPWVHNNIKGNDHLKGFHFWLRKYLFYKSALGIPISTPSSMGYCLLCFHHKPHIFDDEFIAKAYLCAEKVGRILEVERLRKLSAEKARFETAGMAFGCLAHEIRNILTALSADAEVLRRTLNKCRVEDATPSEKVVTKFNTTQSAIDRAISISQTLLGVQSKATNENVDVFECVSEAIKAAKTQIPGGKRIEVKCKEHPEKKCFVNCNRSGLVLSLFNLLFNAIEQIKLFVRSKGLVWIDWQIFHKSGVDLLRIDIKDTGPGIHKADFEKIFRVGFTTKPGGTGLGLHICRQTISAIEKRGQKGKIKVGDSKLCVGTTFSVFLPIANAHS